MIGNGFFDCRVWDVNDRGCGVIDSSIISSSFGLWWWYRSVFDCIIWGWGEEVWFLKYFFEFGVLWIDKFDGIEFVKGGLKVYGGVIFLLLLSWGGCFFYGLVIILLLDLFIFLMGGKIMRLFWLKYWNGL